MREAKKFVLSIYPDVEYRKYGDGVYSGRSAWFVNEGYIGRIKPADKRNVALAYDILVSSVYNERAGWLIAKQIIEQRMLEKLEQ